jgi:hemin uptake protein HemP
MPERDLPEVQPSADEPASATPIPQLRVFTSEQLFGEAREIWIQHGDVQYRLRITSTDKLVLTK